ncbi:pirin family protein [Flavobacterium sp. HSC-61S13]|uniref:pirin family protein n=1 Tax=Flavobacterium sp. HSC-61S13 TaxID=2910963 RepID=UPI0020A00460|nr:pirin family protein [Flavobacterium sp. HSC-61S13]MCP1994652.1 redox-sensitive bicupin YhaK (pirin superfamily) [Flavobacterium sp. HSC-61S13]
MSNISFIIEERPADIGNFLVGRLLPFRQKRSVGPFVFIDHMGPAALKDYENLDVPPHPHIGLSTLTYLFEGSIMHKDSLGTEVEITPGAVNWMTAGKGITHSERTPEYLRHTDKNLHGLQIWVALPKELEHIDPSFTHINADELPHWTVDDVEYKLIAGHLFDKKSPVPVHSPLYLLELKSKKRTTINIGSSLFGESGMYILEGEIISEENRFESKQILIAKDSQLCQFEMAENTTVYIFGGEVFPEPRHIEWNFVSSDLSTIEKAKADWIAHRFPKVPGDDGYVPLPEKRI